MKRAMRSAKIRYLKREMLSSKNAPETDQNVSTEKEHERLDKGR